MKPNMTDQLIDYLEGNLTDAEIQQVELELSKSDALRREMEELRQLFQAMDEVPIEQPSEQLSRQFYQFLQLEATKQKEPKREARIFTLPQPMWLVAAAVALLTIGVCFGVLWQTNSRQQEQINSLVAEIETTRNAMILSMLQEQSASQRIKAVNTAVEQRSANPQVVNALIQTLLQDDNVNVRMKAAEALAFFAHEQQVVTALIQALQTENSPEVQIALIDVLTNLKAPEALDEFKNLMENDALLDVVKNKAAHGVEILL